MTSPFDPGIFDPNIFDAGGITPGRTLTLNGVNVGSNVRLASFVFVESASRGEVGIGGFYMDDPTGDNTIPAMKSFTADEAAASPTRMFTGYTQERTTQRGPNRVAGQREFDVELLDLNVLADDYVLSGSGANRSEESDYARVTWLLTTVFNTVGGVSAGTVPNSNTVTMDAVDYRGRTPRDVLNECAEASGKNWFIYRFSSGPLLFYDLASNTNLSSTSKISDVASDVDESTVWAPIGPPKVKKNPDRIYSTVRLKYKRGTVTVSNATTLANYRRREKSILDLSVKTSAKATAKANKFLDSAANELLEVSDIAIDVPAAYVNDIRAGHRVQIKLTRHGISSYTYFRVLRRVVQPSPARGGVSDVRYRITFTLASDILPMANGRRGGDDVWEEKSNATDDGASVIVDSGGITVTNGAITVTNGSDIVIIDGSSDMFRIVATGTVTTALLGGAGASTNTATIATGLTYDPANLIYTGSLQIDYATPFIVWNSGTGLVTDTYLGGAEVVNTDETRVTVETETARAGGLGAITYRYFILEQQAT